MRHEENERSSAGRGLLLLLLRDEKQIKPYVCGFYAPLRSLNKTRFWLGSPWLTYYPLTGLGAMMARALALNGASKVFIIGRRLESLEKTAASVPTGNIIPVQGDVTCKASLQQAYEKVSSQTDHVDVLICNSGIGGPWAPSFNMDTGKPFSFEELHKSLWAPGMDDVTHTYKVNVTGVYFTAIAFLPLLHAANLQRPQPSSVPRPQIIATSSVGAFIRRNMGNLWYGPSKMALVHLMKQLSTVLVDHDIRCNVLAPGLYLTELTDGMYQRRGLKTTHNVEGTFDRHDVPATRTGDEQDMAGLILWLCSRAGSYISGCTVVSDGGRLAVYPATY